MIQVLLTYLLMADVMISDTSSTIYGIPLLNKPVITLRCNIKGHLLKEY